MIVNELIQKIDPLWELEPASTDWQTTDCSAIAHDCRQWLSSNYNDSVNAHACKVHKFYIQALIQLGGPARAFTAYALIYQGNGAGLAEQGSLDDIVVASDALLCCSVVRNEALRLPYFLAYYRSKGVSQFFVVDNGSTDNTLSYLLAQPDVWVWRSTYPFKRANFGSAWFEILLQSYGIGHWVLTVDADELLYYPNCEEISLQQFCQQLEAQQAEAYSAILIDMYADQPIQDTHYQAGQRFESVCPFFDRQFYHHQSEERSGLFKNQIGYWGGVRLRVFGGTQWHYCLNKVPLLKYSANCILVGGQHAIGYPAEKIACQRGGLLHFKFFSKFAAYSASEVLRAEHASDGVEYQQYHQSCVQAEEMGKRLSLYSSEHSIQFHNSAQLLSLGIIGPRASSPLRTVPAVTQMSEAQASVINRRAELLKRLQRKIDAQQA